MKLGLSIFQIIMNRKSLIGIDPFYCELLIAWNKLTKGFFVPPVSRDEILFSPIFHNPFIRNESDETLFNHHFIDGGIVRISDLMYEMIPRHLPAEAVHECIIMTNPTNQIPISDVQDYISLIVKAIPHTGSLRYFHLIKLFRHKMILSSHLISFMAMT